jgi:hypothetical protein
MSSRVRTRRFGFALLAIVAVAFSLQALWAASDSQFTAQEFLEPIKYLASDQLKGRGDGTPELDKAAKYIAGHFRQFGLRPGGDNGTYLQHFTLVVGATLGHNNSMHWQQGSQSETLKVEQSFVPLTFSTNASIDAPLVFAGYGITAPEYHYDDYTHLDVTGKIVIVLRHEPQEDDEKSVFAGKQLTAHAQIPNKAINAKNHGASGIIIVNDIGNHPGEPDSLIKLGAVSGPQEMSIPIVQVKADVVDQWLKPSGHTLDELRLAIDKDLSNHSFALEPSAKGAIQVDIERIRRQVANVIGELPGSDPKLADQYIVVGAHYDHLGLGEHDSLVPRLVGQIHHGADDNASGTAGVLELADAFTHASQKPKHSIVFICFAGEELGLLGSNFYANHPTYSLKQTTAMLNMDMIGRVSKNKLYVSGTGTSPGFQQLVQDANKPLNFEIAYSNSGYGASDQTSFTVKEIPVLFFFSGLHADYHKPSDTWDKINAAEGARVVELVANVVNGLDALNDKPQYVRVAESVSAGMGGGGGYGAYFGSIPDFGEVEHGVKFSDVRDGSPAAKAGLKAGDILIEFDGKKIDNLYDFTYALRSHKPGEKVSVSVMRGNEKITRDVTLEVRK